VQLVIDIFCAYFVCRFVQIVARVEQMNLILMRLLNSDIGQESPPHSLEHISDHDDPFADEMEGPKI
jgi:hypothetical protein